MDAETRRERSEKSLKAAFAAGAVADAGAMVPLLSPTMSKLIWGTDSSDHDFVFSQRYASALMMGWTLLLVWAYVKPLERAFVAPLTMQVIVGIMASELYMISKGRASPARMVPAFTLQVFLLLLFGRGYLAAWRERA